MALALPLVGALAGGAIAWGTGATLAGSALSAIMLGASVGWMVGSWVMFSTMDPTGGKNQILDPGAQEMPRFNTAIRGQVVPVLFGTNRVASQIVWQANFQSIRHETSSSQSNGGKSGGSGGGKGMNASSPSQINYTYKIDSIYHLGLVPRTVKVLGGWLGGQRINDGSISALGLGSDGFGFVSSDLNPSDQSQGNVGISYDEGIWFPGDIAQVNDWPWLTSQVGGSVVWPGTAWVGFKGLNMGASPQLPQLSFELGPQGQGINWSSQFKGFDHYGDTTPGTTASAGVTNNRIDKFGNAWIGGANGVDVVNNQGVKIKGYSWAQLQTLMAAACPASSDVYLYWNATGQSIYARFISVGGGYGPDERIIFTFHASAGTYQIPPGYGYTMTIITCTADAAGNLTTTGGAISASWNDFPTPSWLWGPYCVNTPAGQENQSPLTWGWWSNTLGAHWQVSVTPSVSWMEGGNKGKAFTLHSHKPSGMANWLVYENGKPLNQEDAIFFLPHVKIEGLPPAPVYYAAMYRYIGRDIANSDQSVGQPEPWYAANCVGAFVNGGLACAELSIAHKDSDFGYAYIAPGAVDHTLPTAAFVDLPFIDTAGNGYDNFDDEWDTFLGDKTYWTSVTSTPKPPLYYGIPSYYHGETSGAFTLYWVEPLYYDPMYLDPAYNTPGNFPMAVRVRAYIYDPAPGSYKFYEQAKIKGYLFMFHDILPHSSGSGGTWDPEFTSLNVDSNGNITYYFEHGPSGGADLNSPYLIVGNLGAIDQVGGDEYPPYIIRQILVNDVFGLQPGADIIDEATYQTALTYCITNNIKVSTQYRRDEQAITTIELLLSLYGGWLTVLPGEGKIKFGVTDLQNNPVRTLDNSHFLIRNDGDLPVNTTKGALSDTYNLVRVNYIDRDIQYEQNMVEDGDEVDQDLTGVRVREFPAQFVMTRDLAQWIATRALWSNLYTRDAHQFYLGWKDADLEPGDKVTLVDSFSPNNLNQVAQIVSWKEVERGIFDVTAVQQLPYIASILPSAVGSVDISGGGTAISSLGFLTSSGTVSTSGITTNPSCAYFANGNNGPLPAPADFQMYELPAEFQLGTDSQLYVGWRTYDNAYGADLYVSVDNVSFAPVLRTAPYPIAGTLFGDMPNDDRVQERVPIVILPASGFYVNSPTFATNVTLNDVDAAAMSAGAGLLWVGSEMLAYRNVTVMSQNTYMLGYVYRGWGGTAIQAHSSGDTFYKHGGGIFARSYTEDQIGSKLYYKVVPFNASGFSYPVSSVSAKSYTIQGGFYRPQIPSAVQFNNQRGLNKTYVGSTIDIPLTWKDSARRSGYGAGGYGSTPLGYGQFVTDTLSHAWRVSVVGSGGTIVRTTAVSTPAYTYTSSQNAADNGAWFGKPVFTVTPFSPSGDAPRSSVISLELF